MDISTLKSGDTIKYCKTLHCNSWKIGIIKYIAWYQINQRYFTMENGDRLWESQILEKIENKSINIWDLKSHDIISFQIDGCSLTGNFNYFENPYFYLFGDSITGRIDKVHKDNVICFLKFNDKWEKYNIDYQKKSKDITLTVDFEHNGENIDQYINQSNKVTKDLTIQVEKLTKTLENFNKSKDKSFSFEGYMNSFNQNTVGANYNYQITLGFMPNTISNLQELPKFSQKYKVTFEPIE